MLDNAIIGIYLCFLLAVGLYNKSRSDNMRHYAQITPNIQSKLYLLFATLFTNSVGGGTVFGLSERVFSQDLSYVYAVALTVIIDLLAATFWIPKIAKYYGVISLGEIFAKYYGKLGRIFIGITASMVSFGYVAIQISVSSRIFEYILHVNYVEGVILSYLILITYTAIGGLKSIVMTNFLQFIATIAFVPIVAIIGVYHLGVQNFLVMIPEAKYNIQYFTQDIFLLFLSFSFLGMNPSFIQRAFMTENYRQTQKAILIKSGIYLLFLVFIAINGLIAHVYCADLTDSNMAMLALVDKIIPIGIKGLVILGFLAAIMSSADAELNIASISLINDVFIPIFNLKDNKIMVLLTQIGTVIIGSFAIFLALRFHNIIELILFVGGLWLPLILPAFIASLYDITISKSGLIICAIAGGSAFTYWQIHFADQTSLKSAFIGLVANLMVFIIIKTMQNILGKNKSVQV